MPALPRLRPLRWSVFILLSSQAMAGNPLGTLSDEFDHAPSLANWSRINVVEGWNANQLQLLDVDTTVSGALVMRPWTSTWYQNWRGEMTFKNVTGDFAFTIDVTATGGDGSGLPEAAFSLGGAMIRTPLGITSPAQWNPGHENYVFLSVGYGFGSGPCSPGEGAHLEVKTTVNSNSDLCITPTSVSSAEIQIAKIGAAVICLYRSPGGAWQVHRRYARPDMPATLQVGMVSYTDWFKASTYDPFFHNGHVLNGALAPDPSSNPAQPFFPDVQATFDYARFASIVVPPELVGVNLVTQASDAQLLSFLGEHANPQPHAADLDGDGAVNASDLAILLGGWGGDQLDLTGDGTVDAADLAVLLGEWSV
jgi:hypothetical protein